VAETFLEVISRLRVKEIILGISLRLKNLKYLKHCILGNFKEHAVPSLGVKK
jgi:hypothetical protein